MLRADRLEIEATATKAGGHTRRVIDAEHRNKAVMVLLGRLTECCRLGDEEAATSAEREARAMFEVAIQASADVLEMGL